MTAYELALAAIAERRELLAAGTPGPWSAVQGASGNWWIEQPNRADVADLSAENDGQPDAALIVAMHAAFAADTDALEAVLLRHAPYRCCDDHECRCKSIGCSDYYPCPDARAVLTALGIDPNGDTHE